MTQAKQALRARFRSLRRSRSIDEGEAAALLASFTELRAALEGSGWSDVGEPFVPALFWPTATEPDVRSIALAYPRALLPVLVDPSGVLLRGPAWAWGGAGVAMSTPNPRWPAQPPGTALPPTVLSEAALVLVPAVAVDLSGARLGHGGGWYDRALLHRRPGTPVVAVVLDDEVLPAGTIPAEPHDVPVDAILTPRRYVLLP